MRIVERIARLIDAEGAYAIGYGSSHGGEPLPTSARQRYFRAKYISQAMDIVRMVLQATPEEMRRDLIETEVELWRELGLSIDDIQLRLFVENKYGNPR